MKTIIILIIVALLAFVFALVLIVRALVVINAHLIEINDNLEYQPKRFYGKINLSSNDQYKVKRPYNYQEKKEEEPEPETEKVTFFNSKLDLNKENSNLKELDTKEDLFLNKFMTATNNTSLGFSSSKENSMQNIPPIKQDKDKKIKINYEDMEVENRDDFEINDFTINGNYILSGTYKDSEIKIGSESFNYKIPFTIMVK